MDTEKLKEQMESGEISAEINTEESDNATESQNNISSDDKAYLKEVLEMVKSMRESVVNLETTLTDTLKDNYGLSKDILDVMVAYTKKDIEALVDSDIKAIIEKYATGTGVTSMIYHDDISEMRDALYVAKDASLTLYKAKTDAQAISNDTKSMVDEYVNYLSSGKVKKSIDTLVNNLKSAYEIEENPDKKKTLGTLISRVEKAIDLTAIYERFEKLGEKEVKDTIIAYFDGNVKGKYIMDKFLTKVEKFGYKQNIFKYFFNIEENFLPEEYHCFNNFFLFLFMRAVAYADPYNKTDKLYVKSLVSHLSDLIYHRFPSTEDEKRFIDLIISIEDRYVDYKDEFIENNITYKNHPARIELEKSVNDQKLNEIRRKLANVNLTWDENETVEELQIRFDEYVKNAIRDQSDDLPDEVKNVELSLDDETSEETSEEEPAITEEIVNVVNESTN